MNDVAAWVPHGVLLLIATTLGTLLWRVLSGKGKDLLDEVKAIRVELTSLDKKLGTFATVAQLGNLGDRFDQRMQAALDRLSGVERELAVLKVVPSKKRGSG